MISCHLESHQEQFQGSLERLGLKAGLQYDIGWVLHKKSIKSVGDLTFDAAFYIGID